MADQRVLIERRPGVGDSLHVTVLPDGVSVEVRPTETILAALARAGYKYRIGCKRGGCGVCKVTLLAGEVTYERTVAESVLSEAEQATGVCLSCRAVPTTAVTIELQDDDVLRRVLPLGFLTGHVRDRDAQPPEPNPFPPATHHQPRKG